MKLVRLLLPVSLLVAACEQPLRIKNARMSLNAERVQQNLQGPVKNFVEMASLIDSTGRAMPDTLVQYTEFDERGYLTRQVTRNAAGKVVEELQVKHNEAGAMTEYVQLKNGRLYTKLVPELDAKNQYIGGKTFDSSGRQTGYYSDLAQNEYGIVYKARFFDMNKQLKQAFSRQYNKQQYLGGTETDSIGSVVQKEVVKVNERGDRVEEESTSFREGQPKTEKKRYRYDRYDPRGNWTQRLMLDENGKPVKLHRRTYAYYQ